MPASRNAKKRGHSQPTSGRLAGKSDPARVDALAQESFVRDPSVFDGGRVRVFGSEPVVKGDGPWRPLAGRVRKPRERKLPPSR